MSDIRDIYSLHAPNVELKNFRTIPFSPQPDGEDAFWRAVVAAKPKWLKFLNPDHPIEVLRKAKAQGYKTIWRAPGEGEVNYERVLEMIYLASHDENGNPLDEPVVDVIELGNEPIYDPADPNPYSLWVHVFYMKLLNTYCSGPAKKAQIKLCTPGWRDEVMFPPASVKDAELRKELHEAYDRKGWDIGIHVYGRQRLVVDDETKRILRKTNPDFKDAVEKIAAWVGEFAHDEERQFHVSEAGIPERLLSGYEQLGKAASDIEKANRYYTFLSRLRFVLPRVASVSFFLFYGTEGFERFNEPGDYMAQGGSSYWLSMDAWKELARRVAF